MSRALALLVVLGIGPSVGAQDCARPIANGLSWWPGDTSAADLIGGNPGTLQGGASVGPGRVGQGFVFDGTDDHVGIPFHASYDFQLPGQFSIVAWVRAEPGSPSVNRALVVKSPTGGAWDWGLYLEAGGRFMAGRNGLAVVTSRTVAVPGVWYHVAVTYQDSLWHLYVNGTREATNSGILITRSTGGLALARRGEATSSPDPFGGVLDEVEIFDRPLTPCAVAFLADLGQAGQCKGDDDADGVSDTIDNCIRLSNPSQIDQDGDKTGDACDCAPADLSTYAIPSEIGRLIVGESGKDVLSWCSATLSGGTSSVHQVLRGEVVNLPVGGGIGESCLQIGSPSTTLTDATVPPATQSFWYLVRGKNACGTGTYGFSRSHETSTERITPACP